MYGMTGDGDVLMKNFAYSDESRRARKIYSNGQAEQRIRDDNARELEKMMEERKKRKSLMGAPPRTKGINIYDK